MKWKSELRPLNSDASVQSLIDDVITPNPNIHEELEGVKVRHENQRLDKESSLSDDPHFKAFKKADIDIEVPSGTKGVPSVKYTVPGLLYRKLTDVIVGAFQESDPLGHHLHFSPFKLFRKHPVTDLPERVHSEVYNSDAFIHEHDQIQRHGKLPPDNPTCKLEKVIGALMFCSDGTHLADFGTAKAWPIYLMLGNLSKYFRSIPGIGALHDVAYIPTVILFHIINITLTTKL
jgi:hypothetical protein